MFYNIIYSINILISLSSHTFKQRFLFACADYARSILIFVSTHISHMLTYHLYTYRYKTFIHNLYIKHIYIYAENSHCECCRKFVRFSLQFIYIVKYIQSMSIQNTYILYMLMHNTNTLQNKLQLDIYLGIYMYIYTVYTLNLIR